jgi:hypothetical protein
MYIILGVSRIDHIPVTLTDWSVPEFSQNYGFLHSDKLTHIMLGWTKLRHGLRFNMMWASSIHLPSLMLPYVPLTQPSSSIAAP